MKATSANTRRREMRRICQKADEYYETGDFKRSCLLYEIVNNHNRTTKDIQLKYGKALLEAGDFPAAVQMLRDAVARNPLCANARLSLSHVYYKMSDYLTAERVLEQSLTLSLSQGDTAQIYYSLGIIHQEQNNYGIAQEMFETALTIEKDSLEPYLELAKIHLHYGMPKDARLCLEQALHNCGISPDLRELMNECRFKERLITQQSKSSAQGIRKSHLNHLSSRITGPSRIM